MTNNTVDLFNEKIDTLNNQFFSSLDDFRSSYILYHKNQNNEEYMIIFSKNSYNIYNIIKNSSILMNDIQKETNNVNKNVNDLDTDIKEEKEMNDELLFKIQQIKGSGKGSKIMNKNSKEMYREQYVRNWTMFLGIFFLSYGIFSTFKKG